MMSDRGDHPMDDSDLDAPDLEEPDPSSGGIVDLDSDQERGRSALESLFGADGPDDIDVDALSGPVCWPKVHATELAERFTELRDWVQELFERYEHLDHTIIPPCWWQHPGHVEALQALKDHERASYADTSPAQAALAWQRDLQFIEIRLREWTAVYGCDRTRHRAAIRSVDAIDEEAWSAHLEAEHVRRVQRDYGRHGTAERDLAAPRPDAERRG